MKIKNSVLNTFIVGNIIFLSIGLIAIFSIPSESRTQLEIATIMFSCAVIPLAIVAIYYKIYSYFFLIGSVGFCILISYLGFNDDPIRLLGMHLLFAVSGICATIWHLPRENEK